MKLDNRVNMIELPDTEQLADKAASIFLETAKQAIENAGIFRAAVSGGSTPRRFFQKLSDPQIYAQVDWSLIHLFWVDERCVPPSSEASNFGLATETFLLDIPIPGENVHRVEGEAANHEQAVVLYENIIRSVFRLGPGQVPQFDLILLGMGADGHIASILPNTYAQFDTDDLVRAVYRMDGDYNRITLTIPVLLAASKIAVLINGSNKAAIVRDVFQSEPDPVKYPVHALWPVLEKVVWLIDKRACAML